MPKYIFGINGLTADIAMNAVPFLPQDVADNIREAKAQSQSALEATLGVNRQAIFKILGLEDKDDKSTAFANVARDMRNSFDGDDSSYYSWLNDNEQLSQRLDKLNTEAGACTPRLAMMLMQAPTGADFAVWLCKGRPVVVSDVPDVPLSFIDDYPELLSAGDYTLAFMEAYIRSCLALFFPKSAIEKALSNYTPEKMRLYFPRIVWELSNHTFNEAELCIFDNLSSF